MLVPKGLICMKQSYFETHSHGINPLGTGKSYKLNVVKYKDIK